jgi:RNA polymerase sigma factor (sigma-70 family)
MKTPTSTPLTSDDGDTTDRALVERAIDGSRDALRLLVERHQPFVYNVALKMFGQHADAHDLTQEVFVKVITSLKTFRHDSTLRTWLYRVTVNHFLKTKRRAKELPVADFETFFDSIAAIPDEDPSELPASEDTIEELRLRCTSGMLMCLEREQRITFILGAMFGLSHQVGAEALGISPGNFRVRLHRARQDLYNWMNSRCGLVNKANPCRCSKKTTGYVRLGVVDPNRLVFNTDYVLRVESLTKRDAANALSTVQDLHERVFATHPLQAGGGSVVDDILGNPTLRSFFSLG